MDKTFNRYVNQIKNQILPPEEETRLIFIYQSRADGWEDAQEKIIKSNLMFVVKTAFEFSSDIQKVDELISEGNLSLLESLDKFDPNKGFKFLTYASFDVRGRMIKHISKNSYYSALKISAKNIDLAKQAKEFIESFKNENKVNPSVRQIANHCQINESKALLITELATSQIFSIHSLSSDLDEIKDRINEIPDDVGLKPDAKASCNEISTIIKKIIERLPLRQQLIINKRFGLNGESPTDLATIGQELDLTKERIRQIESSVLKAIRKEIEKITNEFNLF
ncbi:MAG: sigma-70 family RNA polymerase sigma factor [Chlamydiae bacterium]|nr:sigma-70 family RNA polymerase sigma factor [Chlamydiota bacterium]